MADPYIGHDSHCIGTREDSYASGTGASYHHFGVFQSFDPADSREKIRPRDGSSRNIVVTETVGASYGGEISYLLQDARFLEFVLGGYTEDATGPNYNHTMDEAKDIPSFRVEVLLNNTTDGVRVYKGCKVSTFTVSGSARQAIECSASFIAQTMTPTDSGQSTPSRLSDAIFTYQHVTDITWNSSSISDNVPEFEFTIDNGLEERPQAGSLNTAEPCPLNRTYSGTLTIQSSDLTFWNAFANDTNASLVFTFRRTASSDEIIFTFSGVEFDNPGGAVNVEELHSQTIEWVAKSLSVQVNTTTQDYEWD